MKRSFLRVGQKREVIVEERIRADHDVDIALGIDICVVAVGALQKDVPATLILAFFERRSHGGVGVARTRNRALLRLRFEL